MLAVLELYQVQRSVFVLQVVSFDGSTTVQEFLYSLHKTVMMRDGSQSGFSLYTDDPGGADVEHCLQVHLKVSGSHVTCTLQLSVMLSDLQINRILTLGKIRVKVCKMAQWCKCLID